MFNGFLPPTENWSKLPHQFIEALPQVETIAEMKVILYILRHTWGYHDSEKKITIDEFCNGRKRKDGTRIDNGTGLSANAIRDGIGRAIEHGFICVDIDNSDKARIKKYYKLTEPEKSGVQTLNPRPSNSEPQGSNIDHRTEKETKERNQGEENEPPPSDFELIQSAIKEACKVASSDSNKGKLYKATREAIMTGKTPELIIEFGQWFNETYWPGKWPSIEQVSTDWPKFKEFINGNGNGNGRNSNQPNVVLPATANSDGSYNF